MVKKIIFTLLFVPTFVCAQDDIQVVTRFAETFVVPAEEIVVPTVLELTLPATVDIKKEIYVVEAASGSPVFSLVQTKYQKEPTPITIESNGVVLPELTDNLTQTNKTFSLPENKSGEVTLIARSEQPITAASFQLDLAQNVSLPTRVSVSALDKDGIEQIILAATKPNSTYIRFPETVSNQWTIKLSYAQPLRIEEVYFTQTDVVANRTSTLRFLAQPQKTYNVYVNPERSAQAPVGERNNLEKDEGVFVVESEFSLRENPQFVLSDLDNDSIPDRFDNCVDVVNARQTDIDKNGRGDVCDDFDRDGIENLADNCKNTPNKNQTDEDGDGIGDVCDDEESRVTEKHAWIPWLAIGVALLIFGGMFWVMMRRSVEVSASTRNTEEIQPPVSDV